MVWCAINGDGDLVLRRCPKKVNADAYCNILQSAINFIRPRYLGKYEKRRLQKFLHRATRQHRLFQQDGASAHTANRTQRWLASRRVQRFNGGDWPAMSPDWWTAINRKKQSSDVDLNPVENVWPPVLRALEGRFFHSLDDLWQALEVAFTAIPASTIQDLYASIHRRLAAVIVNKGGHTKY